MQTFGERLKEQRKALGLSRKEFGVIGGVEANAQGRYGSGERVPEADYLMAIGRHAVDLLCLLTGVRSRLAEGSLSQKESAVIQNYRHLGDEDQQATPSWHRLWRSVKGAPRRFFFCSRAFFAAA